MTTTCGLNFSRDFPDAAVIRLETNYRSTEPILAAANAVIRHNPSRHEKTLRASCGPGDPVRILAMEDEEHEAEFVVQDLIGDIRRGRARNADAVTPASQRTQRKILFLFSL